MLLNAIIFLPLIGAVLCLIVSIASVLLVGLTLHQMWHIGWTKMAWISVIAVVVMSMMCAMLSRRRACKILENDNIHAVNEVNKETDNDD